MTLVIAASPLIAMAASRDFVPARLMRAANRFADGFRVDDRFLIDRVRRCRLGGIGLDAVASAALDELDQLDGRGRDVEADEGSFPTGREHSFSFPTPEVGLESYKLASNPQFNYNSDELSTV